MVETPQRPAEAGKQGLLEQRMKILVTGYPGLLTNDLVPVLREDHQVFPLSIEDLDITRKGDVFKTIETHRPDVVINCAAYTAVDQAEKDWDRAFQVNALGTHHLALACRHFGSILCHISTDYIFDGRINRPYQPWDIPGPINVCGASKQAGEFLVEKLLNRFYIIRTSSLYGKFGNNFVNTILNKAMQKEPLSIVSDQIMSPTWSVNLSRGIVRILASENFGFFHLTDRTEGGISWFDFAKAILEVRGLKGEIRPISSKNLDRPAPRPPYSVLDTRYLTLATGYQPLHYREALEQFLK
jgi:dTDP-4-dehydrorhamnose reductase